MLEKTLETPLDYKEIQPVHPKGDQSWVLIGRTDAKAETPYFGHLMWRTDSLKRPRCWERLKAGEGDDRGWDGWMASLTQWTWVWVNSGSWWWTGRPGVLQSMGSQRVRHDWATELNLPMFYKLYLTYKSSSCTYLPKIIIKDSCWMFIKMAFWHLLTCSLMFLL